MNRLKAAIVSAVMGMMIGMTSVSLVAYTSVELLGAGREIFGSLLPMAAMHGAIIGGLVGLINRNLCVGEICVSLVLLSIALCAAEVIAGQYSQQSLLPAAIYAMGIVNSLLIAPLVLAVAKQFVPEQRQQIW